MCVDVAETDGRGQQTVADTRLSRMNRRSWYVEGGKRGLFHKQRSLGAETDYTYAMFVHIDETMQFIKIKANLLVWGYGFVTTKRNALPHKKRSCSVEGWLYF